MLCLPQNRLFKLEKYYVVKEELAFILPISFYFLISNIKVERKTIEEVLKRVVVGRELLSSMRGKIQFLENAPRRKNHLSQTGEIDGKKQLEGLDKKKFMKWRE